jgi:hypothetical protein
MKYVQLNSTYKDDTIAEAMYAREVEYFHYEFDAINFEVILKSEKNELRRTDLQDRLSTTRLEMEQVDAIYRALQSQITSEDAHQAAIARTTKKREDSDAIHSDK